MMRYQEELDDRFTKINVWDSATWPRNIILAKLYDNLMFEEPDHEHYPMWESQYAYHINEHFEGNDKYVPF